MYRNKTIGVVILAYNEENHIRDVILDQPEFVDRIYAIDDDSTDDTWNEILAAAHEDEQRSASSGSRGKATLVTRSTIESRGEIHTFPGRVVSIRHHDNRGPGGAAKTGYLQARADEMDITVKVDGDGQMDPGQMTKVIDPIVDGRVEYAKGNRLRAPSVRDSMPAFRLAGNMILTYLTRIASGYWKVSDPLNGYTAISHRALSSIPVEDLYEHFGYHSELLVRLNEAGIDIADVTMPPIYGIEESSINYASFIPDGSKLLFTNFLQRLRTQYLSDAHSIREWALVGGIASIGAISSIRSRTPSGTRNSAWIGTTIRALVLGVLCLGIVLLYDKRSNDAEVVIVDE